MPTLRHRFLDLAALMAAPSVVIAEPGGLAIKEPLESRKLQRGAGRRGESGTDLPIAEGGTGFVAQPDGIVTTTVHVFPEGGDFFKDGNSYGRQAGAVIRAKVFPPKGRLLQSLSAVRVLKATDDQGRAIETLDPENDDETSTTEYLRGGAEQNNSMQIELRLKLPLPDAQAIDELDAEAVAVTAGNWKTMTLTNLTETFTNQFDLGEVLPGAKLTITKLTNKNNALRIDAQIKGPRAVRRLDLRVNNPGAPDQEGMSNMFERRFSTKGDESTRLISINSAMFNPDGILAPNGSSGTNAGPFTLQIRCPEDLRREKISVKLKGLDLL